jgi:peptide chain release factor 1
MLPAIQRKLEQLASRHEEVARLLLQPEILGDPARYRELRREFARLEPVARTLRQYTEIGRALEAATALLRDAELRELATQEVAQLEAERVALEDELGRLLVPRDARDDANAFLEVRAAAGGDEAARFAGDLFRMYTRYAERQGWRIEVLSAHPGEHGGYKEIVARVEGKGAYGRLKFESGVHCVKRVPATEAQGRIHTSTSTVAVLPELDDVAVVELRESDLKIDTFRASGAGGQHVNKTDSAIRITHLPSGIVVECQDERSQHKNRARALALLKARLAEIERAKQTSAQAEARRVQVGGGERSERIRTYRYKESLVTDHRIGLDLHRLAEILDGDLDPLIDALVQADQAEQLQALAKGT